MKVFSYLTVLTLVCFVLLVSCQQPKQGPDPAKVRAAIEANNALFAQAVNSGNVDTLATLYAEDAYLMPQNHEMVNGQENIKEFMSGMLAMANPSNFTLTTEEVMMMGDAACEIGVYSMDINPEGLPQMQDKGKYVVIWQPQADGAWKMQVDIWNTNMPMQPPEDMTKK